MPLLLCLACASPPAPETWLQPSHDAGNFFICTCPSTAQHRVISEQMGPTHAAFASIMDSHPAALDTFLFSEGLICPMHKYCPVSPYPWRSPATSIHSKWGRLGEFIVITLWLVFKYSFELMWSFLWKPICAVVSLALLCTAIAPTVIFPLCDFQGSGDSLIWVCDHPKITTKDTVHFVIWEEIRIKLHS